MLVGSVAHHKGFFITFEGIDGSGKSTQARMVYRHLKDSGRSVILTKEPGDWSEGGKIRDILLNGKLTHDKTELFLFLADRCEHLSQVVIPALARGDIVLCDRYTDSTVAYQCFGRGLDVATINRLFEWCDFPKPDMTLWLSLSLEKSRARMEARGASDRIELDADLMSRVSDGFQALALQFPRRIVEVDGGEEADRVFLSVIDAIGRLIP